METISFKLHKNILKEVDTLVRPLRFSNRTEFIREAIREKLNKIETEKFMRKLEPFKGAAKVKVSDKRLHEIREEVAKKHAEKLGVN